jgi:uncharacterized protein
MCRCGKQVLFSAGNRYSDTRETGTLAQASAAVTASDARHLAWLRDETGDAFAAGIVLHTGPHVFPVSDRIIAAPVSALWS